MSWQNQPRGPDGKWRKSNSLFIGATIALAVVSVPGGGAGVGSVSGTAGTASVESAVGQSMRANLGKAQRSAVKGNRKATWRRLELKRIKHNIRRSASCVGNSHGEIRQLFMHTPCRSLDRMLVRLGDAKGNQIAISIAWVKMHTPSAARSLRKRIDVHATGDIVPLPGAVVGVKALDWTGWNYGSNRSGRSVTIAEVEPVRGNPDAEYMDGVAEVAAKFPRP